jgi:hypothetical protein
MENTIYKFAYYYTTGDGSNNSEPYTNKEEALEAFKQFIQEEIIEDFTEEEEMEWIDYAKLWAEDEDDEDAEEENILFWTFELGYTEYDPPCKD